VRKVRFVLALILLSASIPLVSGHEQQGKLHELMRQKLSAAQKVLEGIALNDFERIAENGEDLIRISKLAEWRVFKTPRYDLHSDEFRRSADMLVARAKEKNLDGAALAYVEMTLTCVRCHKHVREIRMARLD